MNIYDLQEPKRESKFGSINCVSLYVHTIINILKVYLGEKIIFGPFLQSIITVVKYKNCTHLNKTVGITAKTIIMNNAALYIGISGKTKWY